MQRGCEVLKKSRLKIGQIRDLEAQAAFLSDACQYRDATKFVMLSVFTLKETICTKTWAEPLPNLPSSGLSAPLKTSSLKLPIFTIFEDEVTFLRTWYQD